MKLKNGKKGGTDLILNEFLKAGSSTLTLTLVKLFNRILESGVFPRDWNHSLISSIYKSGDPNDCNNYRGISITSCLGKLFTSLLQCRLSNFLESNNLISPNQGGFRSGYRTTDHLFILKTLINKYVGKMKKNLYVCFVDFKKAFDSVDRKALIHKIIKKGIGGKFFELIKNMYSNTEFSCKSGNYYSDPFIGTLGVKQGDSLSPTLFNIFIDDIASCFEENPETEPAKIGNFKLNHLLYADDLVLISESSSGLQHCVNALESYCTRWSLSMNTQKTKVMVFSKNLRSYDNSQFYFDINQIDIVKEYKYLGLIFSSNGKLTKASENLSEKAKKAFFSLKSKIPNAENLSVKNWLKLYQSIISPIATYGSEVWISDFKIKLENVDILPFEKIQNMIMKNVLGVHGKTSNLAVHAELGLFPLCFKIFKLMFSYYIRLESLQQNDCNNNMYDILHSAYEEDKTMGNLNLPSWTKNVYQLKSIFNLQSLDITTSEFKDKIQSFYSNKINTQLSHIRETESGKLRFYSKIYNGFELHKYMEFNLSKNLRSNLSKLRMSAHPLAIETGRYSRPFIQADQRFCKYCPNIVENEMHFVLRCTGLSAIRDKYTNLMNNKNRLSEEEFIKTLLNPKTLQEAKIICTFLKEMFLKRDIDFKNS